MDAFDIVTGGAGFIGSHLTEALTAAGRRVRVIDNLANGNLRNLANVEGVDFHHVDIVDQAALRPLFVGAERVFHLAALADIVPSIESPEAYFRANVEGTFAVVEACRDAGVRKIVYAASSSCYGLPQSFPTAETAPIDPRYPYALTKYLGEQIVLHWSRVYGLDALSLRLFNVFGPRSRTSGAYGAVFGVFLAQLLAKKPLTIVGDGEQTRDFTFVADVVSAFMAAADSKISGEIFNVGTGKAVSVNTLVRLLGAGDVVYVPKRPGEPDCTMADIGKITTQLGWRSSVSIDAGVKVMLDNINYWRDAPVWTSDSIATATASWFKHLGTKAS
jgi:UDP-glucose 4-epimerase